MESIPFTLRQLSYFDAVASEGSLAAAAVRCHVTPTALALAIEELESRLSLQLLVRRKGKGVTLTPVGSRLLVAARALLAGAEAFTADATDAATTLVGPLRVGCFSTLTPFLLPAVLRVFAREHPQLAIDVTEATAPELHDLLLQGRIDTALLYAIDVSPQLAFEPIHEYRPHVIVAADHQLSARSTVHLSELMSDRLVVLDVEPTRRNTEHIFEHLGLRPTVGHVTRSFEVARCLVGAGFGYAVLFQRPASGVTYDGHRVVMIELADDVPGTVAGLARPLGAARTARYRALRDVLRTSTAAPHPSG
ncbi:LysR family transcriptional regulator [Microbacterium sp. SYP-A9085]|uniref:LysR family transcriptional regulator n=1 Tax=Microbacterium sp. SYP-A9085 TaxID=2664454 RepID=UPI00129B6806|nr:LysR family transcriptional regulator [Microbacterium sp. SYP-A9085]MRH30130.1 LysR family transcriptional regulator [Microbacterium sp. SYP-A9085]